MQHKILSNNPTRMQIKKIKKNYKTWIEITANDVCVSVDERGALNRAL